MCSRLGCCSWRIGFECADDQSLTSLKAGLKDGSGVWILAVLEAAARAEIKLCFILWVPSISHCQHGLAALLISSSQGGLLVWEAAPFPAHEVLPWLPVLVSRQGFLAVMLPRIAWECQGRILMTPSSFFWLGKKIGILKHFILKEIFFCLFKWPLLWCHFAKPTC